VVVAHDGSRLLPGLISAVSEQTHSVHRAVGVDTGSRDRSGAALTELLGPDAVFGMEPETGFGVAVARALQHPAARRPVPDSAPDQEPALEWIWLLHDDCEPAPDALEQMLRVASRSRSIAVLGPKLKDFADRRVLREAGVTIDRAGRRFTGVEPGEIDQGQHDGSRAVLAVSSAGMLVRRDVWDQVGGFDANLPLFRDDIDFCWRVHAAGYEVRVVTDAVVYHRELSARQVRKTPATGGHPRLLDRRSALYVLAVNLPMAPMLAVLGGCITGSLARAAYFLVTKQQRKAAAHLGAVAWLLRHPILVRRARARRAGARKHGYAVLHAQIPRARTLSRLAERVSGSLSRASGYESSGLHHAVADEADDEMPMPAADSVVRRVLTSPGVLLFAGLAVVALVAERSLTGSVLSGSGTLGGGALAPAWGGASDLWHEYLAGYHDAGLGSTASTPPYVGVVAALATLLGGKPWLAVDVLLFGCVPAAGMTAFLATRRVTSVLTARVWIAATYALLPVAMGAVAAGRLGTAVAFVLLPPIGITIARMLTGPPRAARRAAWAAGLITAIAAAFVPLVWPIAVIVVIAAVAAWRWLGRRTAVVNALIVAAVPAAVLEPWTFHLLTSPSLFFLEAGLSRPGLAAPGLRAGSLLLLSPGGPGLPPVWVTAGLVLPAFGALLARRRVRLVYAGWSIALSGLVIALVVSRLRVTPPAGGPAVSPWPGIAVAIAAGGLLLAAAPLIEAAGQPLRQAADLVAGRMPRTDWRVLATLAGFAVAASAPVLAAGYWLAAGVGGTVTAASPQVLPAFVAASSAGPDRYRTLVLRQQGGALTYAVLRATDPVLGEPELTEASASTRALAGVVASLAAAGSGDAGDTGQTLGQFDIGYVLLPAPVDQSLAQQLDAAAGVQPLTMAPAYDLWQVSGTVARARVVTSDGTVVPVASGSIGLNTAVAPGTSGTLVLAEAADGWSATLNGKPLTPLAAPVDGWAQGFVLPAGGGRLVVTRDETARNVSLGVEAAVLLAAFVLALPGTRSSVAVPVTVAAGADAEAIPGPGRRERADSARAARRRRRPQFALAGRNARGTGRVPAAQDATTGHGSAASPGSSTVPATVTPPVAARRPASISASAAPAVSTPTADAGFNSAADAEFSSAADARFGSAADAGFNSAADAEFSSAADARFSPAADAGFGSATGAEYARAGTSAGPPAAVGTPRASGYGAGPPMNTAPRADGRRPDVGQSPRPDVSSARDSDVASASGPPRRGHAGQHAARHGKPARRWRGSNAAKSDNPPPASPPPAGPPPARATRADPAPAGPPFLAQDADDGGPDQAWPEPLATESRPPWEQGDAS
jgi:GT2 family glycosyltransferase